MVVHISLCVTMNYGKRISLLTSFLQSSVILKHLHHSLPVRNFVIKKCKWCWAWNFFDCLLLSVLVIFTKFQMILICQIPTIHFWKSLNDTTEFSNLCMGSRWLVCIMLKRHLSEIIVALYRDYYRQTLSDQNFPSRQKHRDQSIVNTSCQKFNKSVIRLKFTAVSLL